MAVSISSLSRLRCRFSSAALRLVALHLCAACSFAAAKQVPLMNQSKMHNRGQLVVVQEDLNRVVLFSKTNSEDRTIINVGEKPHEVELSLDGRTAYVSNFGLLEANHKIGSPGTTISVIDLPQKRERTRFRLPPGSTAPHGLKIRPQRPNELFTNAEEGTEEMVVLNAESGTIVRSFPLPRGIHNFVFSADGADVYAFTTSDSIFRIEADTGRILSQAAIPHVRGLAWTSGQAQLIAGARGQISLLNPRDLTVTRTFRDLGVGQTFYPAASPDGHVFLVPAVLDGILLVVDANTGKVRRRIATGSPLQALFDGEYAWVSNVKVPASMLPPGKTERLGGLMRLDLSSFQFEAFADTEDANGIAVAP